MMISTSYLPHRSAPIMNQVLLGVGGILLLACVGWLQGELDQRQDRIALQIEGLAQLPNGEYLKPALLGYHHLGADILWLRLVQVIGKKGNSEAEYEWMYHALDVVTTLDPQYAYAYYAGGVILGDLANRPDLSIRLLEKGVKANPQVWNIPFLLGYNYYFLLGDPAKGAEYIMQAASLPDGPSYLPGLATRMAAEAGSPETALAFLEARLRETQDTEMREVLVKRMKEVIIERDIRLLENAVEAYRMQHRTLPATLTDLMAAGALPILPQEPFGGDYRMDPKTGSVSSSTHPERLRTFFKRKQSTYSFPKVQPDYSFPRTWE
ncbi:MAG: tetratricopeptide repeat protein [Nitrospirae bacterium]|nr:MAG: tetratricopeptide repeat protein [Nitrospirota bacterium]